MAQKTADAGKVVRDKFTTIKVRDRLRRWIKAEAALQGVPMYDFVERLLAKGAKGQPWDGGEAA
jgi:hypothetical protein